MTILGKTWEVLKECVDDLWIIFAHVLDSKNLFEPGADQIFYYFLGMLERTA